MNQPAAAVAVVAAAPSRLVGTPATRGTGFGGSSTAVIVRVAVALFDTWVAAVTV